MKLELIFLFIILFLLYDCYNKDNIISTVEKNNSTNKHINTETYIQIDKDNLINPNNNTDIIDGPIIYKGKITRDTMDSEIGGYNSFNLRLDNENLSNNVINYEIINTYVRKPLTNL